MCANHQIKRENKLAKRCLEAAHKIAPTDQAQKMLKQIARKQTGIKKKKQIRAQKDAERGRAEERRTILAEVHSNMQAKFYYEAIKLLNPLVGDYEGDQELQVLMKEAVAGRDLQVFHLIGHGDQLYREEQIEDAVAIWEQASSLNPDNRSIAQRIARARKVLDKLEEIKSGETDAKKKQQQ